MHISDQEAIFNLEFYNVLVIDRKSFIENSLGALETPNFLSISITRVLWILFIRDCSLDFVHWLLSLEKDSVFL